MSRSSLGLFGSAAMIAVLALPAFAAKPEKVEGAYYVAFKDGVKEKNKAMVKSHGASVTDEIAEAGAIEIKIGNSVALLAIQNNPNVLYVEEVPMRYKMDLTTQQVTPSVSNGLYGLVTTKAVNVHNAGNSGGGIRVGVADTQLDIAHVDIAGNLVASIDCVQKNPCSGSGYQNDGETHATHVAGTILAVNNTSGVLGVAYSSKLTHARVLGPTGGSSSDIMRGVRWMVETQSTKIINLSLGGGLKSRTEENFYKEMRTKGAVVVAATGNDGATRVSYPAAYPVNVAVGAVDKNDVVATFSNKGTGIDVTAPGVLVLSSVPTGTGKEASAGTATSTFTAFGLEFAGSTSGTTGTLVNCGIGNPGECATNGATGFVALIQRGTLDFATKVTNATNQGAAAAIIYNNAAGDFTGTLGAAGAWIPAVSISDAAGATLKTQVGAAATVVNQASSWDYYDGTSMATPHAAGVVALIWASNPLLSASDVETKLKNGCDDKGAAGYDTTYGHGRVNAAKSLGL
ncbi:MAG TPA: S8 family serine peptidase [Thermoanaerobaculia bacterium]|nr:S8 family serine peptidase [Thermoanaerobaculia bacterium]